MLWPCSTGKHHHHQTPRLEFQQGQAELMSPKIWFFIVLWRLHKLEYSCYDSLTRSKNSPWRTHETASSLMSPGKKRSFRRRDRARAWAWSVAVWIRSFDLWTLMMSNVRRRRRQRRRMRIYRLPNKARLIIRDWKWIWLLQITVCLEWQAMICSRKLRNLHLWEI